MSNVLCDQLLNYNFLEEYVQVFGSWLYYHTLIFLKIMDKSFTATYKPSIVKDYLITEIDP